MRDTSIGKPLAEEARQFLPFSRPSITAEDIAAVADVLKSGWITTGSRCTELEQQFKAFTGCTHAVAVTSATAGMHLLLHELGIGPGTLLTVTDVSSQTVTVEAQGAARRLPAEAALAIWVAA